MIVGRTIMVETSPPAAPTRRDVHRIGGGSIDNLQLKDAERTLVPPGISVLVAASPPDAARQMRSAFPTAASLHELARTVGSSSVALIRAAGFDVVHAPTRKFPNHSRIIHPAGLAGFSSAELARLSAAFDDTHGL
jgi:hypothetical protein